MSAPRFSFVIVSYHTGDYLWNAIASVRAQIELCEIIVVNNGNPADVEDRLNGLATTGEIILVSGQGNVGFATACNLGASQAAGEYLILLNPDGELSSDAMDYVAQDFAASPEVMLVGGALLYPDGTEQRGSRRNLMTPQNAIFDGLGLSKALPFMTDYALNLEHTPMPHVPIAVGAVSGAFMAFRREDYRQLGGMDEKFFLHVEDMDICRRVWNAGGNVVFDPRIRITHHLSTSNVTSRFVEMHKTRGFNYYFSKHFTSIVDSLFWQPLLMLLAGIRFFVRSCR